MENKFIDFRKERDFGEVFNATFYFIKQEYKRLGMAAVYFILPFALISAVAAVIYQTKALGLHANTADPEETLQYVKTLYWNIAKLMFAYSFTHAAIISTVYGYIRLYIQKGPQGFTAADVWTEFRKLYLPVYGTMLLAALMIGFGTLFCLFPGLYLAISMCLLFAALLFEKKGLGNAISRTFQLTHMAWWWTLLILFVLYILLIMFSLILSIPSMGYNASQQFHQINGEEVVYNGTRIVMLIYSGLVTTIVNILYLIPQVALAFQYFSLVEKREKPTLLDKINEIGKDPAI